MAKKQRTYTVQEGDTIAGIATRFGISVGNLKRINNLDSNVLKVGNKLTVAM